MLLLLLGLVFVPSNVRAQSQNEQSEIPTVPYCELVRNPAFYNEKLIRVRGVYVLREEHSNVYDPGCLTNPTSKEIDRALNETWVSFDGDHMPMKPEVKQFFERLRDLQSRANVTFVGEFFGPNKNGYGHKNEAHFMLDVIRIERVEPLKSN
jgi:hypothetical protein